MEAIIARGVQLLIALGGAYLVTMWFALVVWTFQDIQSRSRSVIAQIFSTLVVVLFTIPGVFIYLILRPRETLDDAFQRSLEEEYLLQDLEELPLCPNCQTYVHEDFVYCPTCRLALRDACIGCQRLIDLRWEICPYCGTEQYPEEFDTELEEPVTMEPSIRWYNDALERQVQAEPERTVGAGRSTKSIEESTIRIDLRKKEADEAQTIADVSIGTRDGDGYLEHSDNGDDPAELNDDGNVYDDDTVERSTRPTSNS